MRSGLLVAVLAGLLTIGSIVFAQYCVPGFQNSYQCSGNWQEQLYINPDCSTYWSNVQYCSNGCYNGFCSGVTQSTSGCSVSASMTSPSTIQSGGIASTTILFTNTGGTGGTVNVNAMLCRSDGTNCFNIGCSSSSVYVPANSVAYDVCSTGNFGNYGYNYPYYSYNYPYYGTNYPYSGTNYPYYGTSSSPYYYSGSFRIKVDMNGCNLATTMYTSIFQVQPYQYCTPGITSNYQCSGNVRQVQYQNSDCSTSWTNLETCPNGCSSGTCTAATSTSTSTSVSTVTMTVTQQTFPFSFADIEIATVIIGLILLLLILILLLTERTGGRRYADGEHWRFWRNFNARNFFASFRKPSAC